VVKAKPKQLEAIAKFVASGRVKVMIEKVFPLRRAGDAHRYLEKTHIRGKIALDVTPGWADLGRLTAAEEPSAEMAIIANEILAGAPPTY
jgi:hypothetical protein